MHFLREFQFPTTIDDALTKTLWNQTPQDSDLDKVAKNLEKLWPQLALHKGEKIGDQKHYAHLRDFCFAYAAHYLPANALKITAILEEMQLAGMQPLSEENTLWLDFGSGPGTLLAGLNHWAFHREKKYHYLGFDQSGDFLRIGQSFFHQMAKKPGANARFHNLSSAQEIAATIRKQKPHFVSFCNSFHEFAPEKKDKEALLESIWKALPASSHLILIEPALKENSRALSELRNFFFGKGKILLPCFDERPCGALQKESDWCHEEIACVFPPWFQTLAKKAKLQKQALLFSYLVVKKSSDAHALEGCSRIVSQRLEQKGQVECYFCTTKGKEKLRMQYAKKTAENEWMLEAQRGQVFSSVEKDERENLQRALPAVLPLDPITEQIFLRT